MESWTKQEVDLTLEMTRNGYKFVDETGENIIAIDWDYWAKLTNITPEQGARLANYINPRTWPGGEYNLGMMPQDLLDDIADLTQLLESKRDKWTLSDLVTELGEAAPWGMIEAAKVKTGTPKPKKDYEKRLDVLRQWMSENGFEEGDKLPKHYTREEMFSELIEMDNNLFSSLELNSFIRHFWRKQKLCELTRGNKSSII